MNPLRPPDSSKIQSMSLHRLSDYNTTDEVIPLQEQRPVFGGDGVDDASSVTIVNYYPSQVPSDDEELQLPGSNVAVLRSHSSKNVHLLSTRKQKIKSLFRKFIDFMSANVPLLGRSAGDVSSPSRMYGALGQSTSTPSDDFGNAGEASTSCARRRSTSKPLTGFGRPSTSTHSLLSSGKSRHRRSSASFPVAQFTSGVTIPAGDGGKLFEGATATSTIDSDLSEDESDDKGYTRSSIDGSSEDPWDNSPYPQVRASVSAKDNYTLSISTPRMWTLSMCFALLGSATNLFFSLRYPSVTISPVIALILVHPLGILWDYFLKRDDDPPEGFTDGLLDQDSSFMESMRSTSRWNRLRLWLAQGKWNEKEHACVYISSNVSFGFAFATDVIVEQQKFYKQEAPLLYQVLLTVSTQILGYAFAGLTRRYLVRPAGMIWPANLMSTAMFTTMHKKDNKVAGGWRISRQKFFVIVWAAAFAWYFVPGLLFPALSYFNVITWFAPKNVVIANLFGVTSGLGLFPMTFDWAQIAYIGSPLLTPWWAAANILGALILVMWLAAPLLYYSNVFFSSYLPILSASVFDDTGKPYNVSKILTPDFVFDEKAYKNYSRIYLPITYILSYAVQFAGLAALVTHTACWNGRELCSAARETIKNRSQDDNKARYSVLHSHPLSDRTSSSEEQHERLQENGLEHIMSGEDVHNRLMKRYQDAPMSWYFITFVAMLTIGLFTVEYYPVHLPWYGLVLAVGITCVLFVPIGILMAITNQHFSLYLCCQIICGMLFPGRPVANMVFVTYCYITMAQGLKFSSDLKLGHYMKIPPRLLFCVQMVATLISSLTQVSVLNWMMAYIPGICTPEAINGFSCPLARVHFNGSILWGVIGPSRFFGHDALYRHLIWAFLVGAILPVIVYVISKRTGTAKLDKVNLPVAFGSLSWIPPATGLNFSVWAVICFFFNHILRKRRTAWWEKYCMTLSAALDSGLAFAVLTIFFAILYPGWMKGFRWWGTEVYKQGCDWQACPYKTLEPGERFGPRA